MLTDLTRLSLATCVLMLACKADPTPLVVPSATSIPTPAPEPTTPPPPTPTGDTGAPPCVPRAVVDPAGGAPILTPPAMSDLAPNPNERTVIANSVFIADSFVGFSWSSNVPMQGGVMWWDQADLPVPSQIDRTFASPSGPQDVGDVTGDGHDDLAFLIANHEPKRIILIPGPLSAVVEPVVSHPSAQTFTLTEDFPGALFRCGDVNADAIADLCRTTGVDFGPPDGTLDHAFDPPLVRETVRVADLDGDGSNEVYAFNSGVVERVLSRTGLPLASLTASVVWTMDLDDDGTDTLYTTLPDNGQLLAQAVTAADFAADVTQPFPTLDGYSFRNLLDGDFDGDGTNEIAIAHGEEVVILEQDGKVRLRIQPTPSLDNGPFGAVMDVGDADGNGTDDLVIGMPTEYGKAYYIANPLDCLP